MRPALISTHPDSGPIAHYMTRRYSLLVTSAKSHSVHALWFLGLSWWRTWLSHYTRSSGFHGPIDMWNAVLNMTCVPNGSQPDPDPTPGRQNETWYDPMLYYAVSPEPDQSIWQVQKLGDRSLGLHSHRNALAFWLVSVKN